MSSLIGQRLGQYEIVSLLGKGGMATVYRARQESIGRDVAFKVIKPDLAEAAVFSERFKREARTVASFSHPHILKVFDFGEYEDTVYLVIELMTGGSLSNLISEQGALSIDTTTRLLDQIAQALDYAHRRGVIHRDLKPQNVLLDDDENAFLTDFGIAKVLNSATGALTQSGVAMGTPAYMPPEQWRGEAVDARADIYALGVMLFEMLTGRVPFQGDTPFSMMYKHLNDPPPALGTIRSDISPAIDGVIVRALAKNAADRYESAIMLSTAFKEALRSGAQEASGTLVFPDRPSDPTAALSSGVTPAKKTPTAPITRPPGAVTAAPSRPPTALIAGSIIVVVLVLLIGAFLVINNNNNANANATGTQIALEIAADTATANSGNATDTEAAFGKQSTSTASSLVFAQATGSQAALTQVAFAALASASSIHTPTGVPTNTAQPTTVPPTATHPPTATSQPTLISSPTSTTTPKPSNTSTTTPSSTPLPTLTPSNTFTNTPTVTLLPTYTPTNTSTSTSTATSTSIHTPTLTSTQTPTTPPTNTDTPTTAPAVPAQAQGALLAFLGRANGQQEIFTVRGDGSSLTPLTSTTNTLYPPPLSWSPDGQQIAFVVRTNTGESVWVMNADGTNPTRFTTGQGTYPAWSPDGDLIAYVGTQNGRNDIFVMNSDGSDVHAITNIGIRSIFLSWSSDSTHVIFLSSGVWVADVTGQTAPRQINKDTKALSAVSSPDGYHIAVVSGTSIYTLDVQNNWAQQMLVSGKDPSWSPDSLQIAYSSGGNIYVANADGSTSGAKPLAAGLQPLWSPDGKQIAYLNNNNTLFVINVDGSGQKQIASNVVAAAWAPVPSSS